MKQSGQECGYAPANKMVTESNPAVGKDYQAGIVFASQLT
jgi:hypothetical protein